MYNVRECLADHKSSPTLVHGGNVVSLSGCCATTTIIRLVLFGKLKSHIYGNNFNRRNGR